MREAKFCLWVVRCFFSFYLACHSKQEIYVGSVLFRTSAYTGAKQASRVPVGSKQYNSPHNDDVKDVSVPLESELINPVKEDRSSLRPNRLVSVIWDIMKCQQFLSIDFREYA